MSLCNINDVVCIAWNRKKKKRENLKYQKTCSSVIKMSRQKSCKILKKFDIVNQTGATTDLIRCSADVAESSKLQIVNETKAGFG